MLGAGTQKVQEDIEEIIGVKTIRLDSDRAKKRTDIEKSMGTIFSDENKIIVGTKLMTRRVGGVGGFSMAVILNVDILLHLPDFRSAEKTFQEIVSIRDSIEPDGEVFIQTRMPQNYVFKSVKDNDYPLFLREEMSRRKSLLYPPYTRFLLMKCISKREIVKELAEIIERSKKDVEILGPFLSKNSQGRKVFKILLRSSIRGSLHSVARTLIDAFKGSKDVTIKVDVDPITL
jgi:primosomal protein N' (replication factor Y)